MVVEMVPTVVLRQQWWCFAGWLRDSVCSGATVAARQNSSSDVERLDQIVFPLQPRRPLAVRRAGSRFTPLVFDGEVT